MALSEALASGDKLGPQERRTAARLARGVVRELRHIDLALNLATERGGVTGGVIVEDRSLLRCVAFLITVEGEPAERVLPDFRLPGPRRPRGIDDSILARIAAALPELEELPVPPDPVRALAQRRSVPDHLAELLVAELGPEKADALLGGLNQEPRLDLRANRLLTDRDKLAARLAAARVATRPTPLAPHGLIAEDRKGLFGELHTGGLFEVQDEGSQLIAALCGAEPGQTVVDLCAGSGGKALALAADVGPTGRVLACDTQPRRLAELPRRARRARAGKIIQLAGSHPAGLDGRADVVLVDAPCSGLGGLRREADLRWRFDREKLAELPALQGQILARAAPLVRCGGRLVYATCSPLRAEGEQVVETFLAAHPGFSVVDPRAVLPTAPLAPSGQWMRVSPELHDTGAFFAAVLRRA